MLRLFLVASLLIILGCCTDQSQESGYSARDLENIEKMAELNARWYGRHPLAFKPLNAEAKAYLESYSKNHVADNNKESSDPELRGTMASKLIEGDIIPSDEDVEAMEQRIRLDEGKHSGNRVERAAPVTDANKWDKTVPIPFIIDPRFNTDQKAFIRTILQTMNDNTCLTFEENGRGKKLEYFLDRGCNSDIGDERDSYPESQKIHLGVDCLTIRTVQHETMHALGFHHTQTRTDRDDHIQIDSKNIKENYTQNYDKLSMESSSTNYGIPYEYASIMHYPMNTWDFQINQSTPTILPWDLDYEKTVYGTYPIFNDWKMINVHYNCNDTCSVQITCQNGGYQHPRRCNECVCPQFHNGTLCEFEREVITLQPGAVKNQNHTFPLDMSTVNDRKLNYTSYQRSPAKLIKAPEGTLIRVTIVNITGSVTECPELCDDRAVEIVDGDDLTRVGKRFCCGLIREKFPLPYSFNSTTNVVGWVVFAWPGLDFGAHVTFEILGTIKENRTDPTPTETEPPQPEPQPEHETEPEIETEPETETEPESEPEPQPEPETEPEHETETEAEPEQPDEPAEGDSPAVEEPSDSGTEEPSTDE